MEQNNIQQDGEQGEQRWETGLGRFMKKYPDWNNQSKTQGPKVKNNKILKRPKTK